MIPLHDDNPTRTFPFVTVGLIVVNCVVFAGEVGLQRQGELEHFIRNYGLVPQRFFGLGAAQEWPTLVYAMFLHGGLLHLLSNMLYLWVFGNNIEDAVGHAKFLFFYLLCGAAAAAGQLAVDPRSPVPMIGASGAVSGVLGAYLALYPRARVLTLVPLGFLWLLEVRAFFFLFYWFALQLINGLPVLLLASARDGGGVAWWAHIGGFAAGWGLIFFFRKRR